MSTQRTMKMKIIFYLFYLFIISIFIILLTGSIISVHGASHVIIPKLSTSKLKALTHSTTQLIMEDVDNILFERVPGTDSHKAAEVYIRSKFIGNQWIVETDTFSSNTPLGPKEFTNIIVTHNSSLDSPFLLLAAHYDSKYFTDHVFVGATDSAVPCAMLIDIARDLGSRLAHIRQGAGLKIVFFDGEEAFKDWTDTDSLYGSRHLASLWHSTLFGDSDQSIISMIEVMVLLDLIGAEAPAFYSLHQNTDWLFDHIAGVETRLSDKKITSKKPAPYFKPRRLHNLNMQDDHTPFLALGVPVLHMIPAPYPSVWHTPNDDRTALSVHTIDELTKIFKVFVAEYLRVK